MSLDSYANLKTALAAWLWRPNDADLTTSIPDMIAMAEAEMNRRIRSRRKAIRSEATITSEFTDLPSDFDAMVSLVNETTDPQRRLTYIDPEKAAELKNTTYTASGQPVYFSIVGDELQVIPSPDSSYSLEMTYRQKIPALSDSNTSNWVLVDHPDIYLYGSLVHAAPFLQDDDRVAVWGTLHERALASLETQDAFSQYPGKLNARFRSLG